MSLTALPPELFSYVVANIESRPTLCHLAQCSRQLYLCTVPHLYHQVTLKEEAWGGRQGNGKFRNLASLLLRRPDLARLVRHFELHVERRSSQETEESEYPEEAKDAEESEEHMSPNMVELDPAFKSAVNALGISKLENRIWLRQLDGTRSARYDIILPLLLPALLRVETLVLDLNVKFDTHYLERIIQRAARRESPFDIQPAFEALCTVFLYSVEVFNVWSADFIASLLMLPAIQKISGDFGDVWSRLDPLRLEGKNPTESEIALSPLTSLDIIGSRLSTADLDHVLRAPKALRTLFYKIRPLDSMDFKALRHALEPQENCLESLGLDYDDFYQALLHTGSRIVTPPLVEDKFVGFMVSFIRFKTLKVLQIAAFFLEHTLTESNSLINIFPPSLETLHLARFEAGFESLLVAVEHLLVQKSPRQIPILGKLIMEEIDEPFGRRSAKLIDVLWRGTQETAIGRLCRIGAAQGVSIDVCNREDDQSLRVWRR